MVFYQDIDLYQGVDADGNPDIDGFGTERPSTTPSRLAIPPSGFPLEQFETNDPSVQYPREDQPFVRAPDGTKENSSPEITSSLPTNRRARRCKPKQQWLLETLSIVISIASMTAVIIVLAKIEGTSLHNWNFFLQPNTVISTLVVISKTSLMSAAATCLSQLKWLYFWKSEKHRRLKDLVIFDDASRGPLGAANFYARMRTFVPLGVLASFVMLLTLVMEPFSQQVLSFVTLPIVSYGEIASIPTSNAYNSTDYVSMAGSSSELYDTMMQGAFYRGLFGMNGALDFQCPSSNCTWPDFSTLALCSTCQDITASTQIQEHDCDESNIISSAFIDTDQNFLNCTNYTFTTPGGGTLVGVVALENATGKYANGTWMTSVVSTLVVANNFGPGDRTTEDDWSLVTTIDVARFNWSETWSLDTARHMMATAFNTTQCSLTWCLKKYSGVSVVNGALNTFSTQDIPGQLLVPNDNSVDYVFTPNVSTLEIAPWMNASNFSVDINLAGSLLGYLVSGLSFNMTTIPDPGWSLQSAVTPEIFLENTNTSGIIQDIAASMTDRIRHSSANASALGSTLRPLTSIRVNWYWIILPIALVLLSAIVLVMTIWDNSCRGAPLWKSGLMPLLFHGLKGWRLDDLRVNSIKEMDRAARRMRTILIEDKPDDVRFVRR